jgi:hypothetical protein
MAQAIQARLPIVLPLRLLASKHTQPLEHILGLHPQGLHQFLLLLLVVALEVDTPPVAAPVTPE